MQPLEHLKFESYRRELLETRQFYKLVTCCLDFFLHGRLGFVFNFLPKNDRVPCNFCKQIGREPQGSLVPLGRENFMVMKRLFCTKCGLLRFETEETSEDTEGKYESIKFVARHVPNNALNGDTFWKSNWLLNNASMIGTSKDGWIHVANVLDKISRITTFDMKYLHLAYNLTLNLTYVYFRITSERDWPDLARALFIGPFLHIQRAAIRALAYHSGAFVAQDITTVQISNDYLWKIKNRKQEAAFGCALRRLVTHGAYGVLPHNVLRIVFSMMLAMPDLCSVGYAC